MLRDEIKQTISGNTRNMNSCEIKIDEIQQTMSNISSENTRNTNSFEMKIQDLKGYFDRQMSNVNERMSHLAEGQAFPEIRQNIVNNNSQHPTGCSDNQYNHQSDKVQINGDSENMSRQNQQTYPYEQFTSHSHNSVNNSQFDPQIQYRNRQFHPSHSGVPSHASKINMKPQYYDGTEDIDEYLNQFEIFTEINNWDYLNKSLYLASSLKEGARVILSELDSHERRDFHSLVKALNNRYGSVNKAEIFRAKLLTRVKRENESLSELAQSIKKLTRQAYPGAPTSVTDTLALDHFIDSLNDPDLRLRVREARPRDVNEAEVLAVRLETYKQADKHRNRLIKNIDNNTPVLPIKTESIHQEKNIETTMQEIRNKTRNGGFQK
ncbi:unnamed protein product [Mytilus coruscus]|uniref:Uncharacterized protein n=1 Tax=Mytilus coruscus TaxID=42192 RepID=A0A6J8D9X3_MYTCO|nr:unnamed protein product [Mytilus coruscus]